MEIGLRGRLTGPSLNSRALAAQGRHEPLAPPEDLLQRQAAAVESRAQGFGSIAAPVALNPVKLGVELGKSRHADDDDSSWTRQASQPGHGRAIVVDVLDDIQGQHGVEGFDLTVNWSGQVGLDQGPIGPIELLEGTVARRPCR